MENKETQKCCSLWGSLTQEPPGDERRGIDAPDLSTAHRGHQTVGSNPCSGVRPGSLSGCCNTKLLVFTTESRKNMGFFFLFVKFYGFDRQDLNLYVYPICLPKLSLNGIFDRQDLNLSFMIVQRKSICCLEKCEKQRQIQSCCLDRWPYLYPATVASPELASVSPVSILKVVVFPAPLTPSRPKH